MFVRRTLAACLLSFALLPRDGYAAAADVTVPRDPPPEALPDAADLVPWVVKGYPAFATGSVVRVGDWLWDMPAGKHGWVTARPDGQLAFADQTPARFWGSTTVYGMTFPDKTQEVARLADAIAATGYNLVRFHHNDIPSKGIGYLQQKPPSNSQLDPAGIDRLDHLAAELYRRGVYVYLDFADSRPILQEDDFDDWEALKKIDNAGWKGLFPQPKVVAAWTRAATTFLQHRNPYTGRTWGEEPGVATVEIINENGPFWDWSFKTTDKVQKWQDQAWNGWLLAKYGGRGPLDAQWTDVSGTHGLYDDEDPARGTVFRPRIVPLLEWDRPYRSKTRGAARVNDYYAHLADTATAFYRAASATIRATGFRGVIVGSHELQGPIDQFAEVQGTGAIAAHLYATGLTAWNARPTSRGAAVEGVDVKTRNWFANIPRIKIRGAPGINGEWTGGTLTRRADVNVAVAAATAFQRVTESLHFSYAHRWTGVPMFDCDNSYAYLGYRQAVGFTYSSVHDEPWMAVNRICAPLFVRGDFARPRTRVHLAFSAEDRSEQNLHALGLSGGSGSIGDAALFLPLLHDVECVFFDEVYDGDADVVFSTGRSASGDYRRAKHAVLVGDNPYCDRYHKTRDLGAPARRVCPSVKTLTLEQPTTFRVTWPWRDTRTLTFPRLEGAVELASLPAGAQPIGKSEDGRYTLGWVDDRFLVLPNGRAFAAAIHDLRWLYRLYLAAGARWKLELADNNADATFYQSDTRELTVDWASGTLIIDTPRTQGFSGFPGWRQPDATRNLALTVEAPYANVLVTSADGQPLGASGRMLLVAAGRMQNTGEEIGKDKTGFQNVTQVGKAPSLIEALRGTVSLQSARAAELAVYALDSEGRRLGQVESSVKQGALTFALAPRWGTLWFEIAASGVSGPAAPTPAAWPLAEQLHTATPSVPELVPLAQLLAGATAPVSAPASETTATSTGATRFVAREFAPRDFVGSYGNAKASIAEDTAKGTVARAQFGKVNQDWYGGFWTALAAPTGVKPEDCLGFSFAFKGDGTLPREAYLTLKTAGGAAYRSKSLNTLFESDAWQDVLLAAADFAVDPAYAKKNPAAAQALPPQPDWQTVTRLDFNCVGPLMDRMSVGQFGPFAFLLKHAPVTPTETSAALRANLPAPGVPASAQVVIPYRPQAVINPDGHADEAAWHDALAIAMDEEHVPAWHFFGSHVVEGKRLNGEGAVFWLLATDQGLALLAEIHTGRPDVIAEGKDWWFNDCIELFTDVTAAGGKPTKQLFLAYRRPNMDRAGASDPGIRVGRTKLADGYALEALIPWTAMGFSGVPTSTFGLEFQLDFGQHGGGRALQMVYGTGTNEAWIKADHFLKARLVPEPVAGASRP